MKKPNLFLVGCGRSGTTSLYYYIRQHPEIFMAEVKGPDFFAEIPNEGYPEFFNNEKKYLFLFDGAKNQKYLGEASHYFHIKTAPEKIKKFNPNSKIIIILRNPFRVIRSYYTGGSIPFGTELNEKNAKKIVAVRELLDSLNYSENIKRWYKYLGKNNVHVIIFEELIENPKKEYTRICKFLKLDYKVIPEYKSYTDSVEMKHKWLRSLISSFSATPKLFIKKIIEVIRENIKMYLDNKKLSPYTTSDL